MRAKVMRSCRQITSRTIKPRMSDRTCAANDRARGANAPYRIPASHLPGRLSRTPLSTNSGATIFHASDGAGVLFCSAKHVIQETTVHAMNIAPKATA